MESVRLFSREVGVPNFTAGGSGWQGVVSTERSFSGRQRSQMHEEDGAAGTRKDETRVTEQATGKGRGCVYGSGGEKRGREVGCTSQDDGQEAGQVPFDPQERAGTAGASGS